MFMEGLSQDTHLYDWLALLHAAAATDYNLFPLLENFGAAPAVLEAARAGLINRTHLPDAALAALQKPDAKAINSDMARLQQAGYHFVPFDHDRYPTLLKQIPAPPPALFVRGDPGVIATCQVALVGSRKPTIDGRKDARYFAEALAQEGITVTSGLAHGIDTEAHRGALARSGCTVAVLGSGLDCIYPRANAGLAEAVCERGAMISEFPLNWRPYPGNFPRRNRIISGLSAATLVVEATRNSGSLITARHALEQNREVLAVPGSIRNPMKQGCHSLLRAGAALVENVDDILAVLGQFRQVEKAASVATVQTEHNIALDEQEKVLLDNIGYEPTSLDEIVNMTGNGIEDIMGKLLTLELDGLITAVAPGSYMRVGR